MKQRYPIYDPQKGDRIKGILDSGAEVIRSVVRRDGRMVYYVDSRRCVAGYCRIDSWQAWCRDNKAMVMEDDG